MIEVSLEQYEVEAAALIGARRRIENIFNNGEPDGHGAPTDDNWQRQIEGACGEIAFAKAVGRYWPASINTFKTGDDVVGCQVRTRSKHWYDLLIRKDDPPNKRYVLVTGTTPHFQVWGWLWGYEAQQEEYLREINNDRPAQYFVPKSALRPINPKEE